MATRLSSLLTDRTLLPRNIIFFNVSSTHFCQRLSKPQGVVRPEGLGKFKISPHRFSNPRPSAMKRRGELRLRLTVSQSVCLGIEHPCGTCDQILLPVGMLLSEICALVSVWRPLWRVDGSVMCSVIIQWSESRRTRNHTFLSHLRLLQPREPGSRIYIPQEQGGPVIPPGTGYPLSLLLRLAGLRRRYSNTPPTWRAWTPYIYPPGTGCPSYTSSTSRRSTFVQTN
jgi:hypothetical protein